MLTLTEEERRARRAEQSRQCRARKSGAAPKSSARPLPTVDDDVVAAIKEATIDMASYRPLQAKQYTEPDLDLEDGTVFMVVLGITEELDMRRVREDFARWKRTRPWHELLRIAVLEVNAPGCLPAVQYYVAT